MLIYRPMNLSVSWNEQKREVRNWGDRSATFKDMLETKPKTLFDRFRLV